MTAPCRVRVASWVALLSMISLFSGDGCGPPAQKTFYFPHDESKY
ncbi:hypothetical protein [Kluyvera intermedia]|nr:hypothetical protein [Kluyvera intermedia]